MNTETGFCDVVSNKEFDLYKKRVEEPLQRYEKLRKKIIFSKGSFKTPFKNMKLSEAK